VSTKPVPVTVPALGDSTTEVVVGNWVKQPGEEVAEGELLAYLESDKVTVELVAPAAGVLTQVAHLEGDTVAVGEVMAYLAEKGAAGLPPPPPETPELVRLVSATQGALWERDVDLQFMSDRMDGSEDPPGRTWLAWLVAAFGRALLAVPPLRPFLVERVPTLPDQLTVLAAVRRMHHVEPFRLTVALGDGPDEVAAKLGTYGAGPRQKPPPVALIVDLEPGPSLVEGQSTFRVVVTLERPSVRDARDGLAGGRPRGRLRMHVPGIKPVDQAALFEALTDCIERG
jgi:pyruvate/2-oxoglutarate dehydrogenase complex dihydrolipoamide acyltransferase (E2) component